MTRKSNVAANTVNEYKDSEQVEQIEQTPAAQSSAPDINLQDLQLMKQIIELCSSRAVFKPNEMAAVGVVYNKLDVFLQAVAEQQKAAEGAK